MFKTLFVGLLTAGAILPAAAQSTSNAASSSEVSVGDPLALTFYLQPKDINAAELEAIEIQTPGSGKYHKFLTVQQFVNKYGPAQSEIENVKANLRAMGFTINHVYANHLAIEAVAPAGTAANALGLNLKRKTFHGHTGIISTTETIIPASLSSLVRGVGGIDTITRAHPLHARQALGTAAAAAQAVPDKLTGGTAGKYLPADFASFYNVTPLYNKGFTGRGSTIGIVTLNDFKESDAHLFWKKIGVNASKTRITKVDVDGGVEAEGNNLDGEGETDLDVEESGALAPNADIRVYIAPNISNASFINAFEAAASENIADTVSTSWGQPELNYFYNIASQTRGETFLLKVFHDAFLEMALQGQTVFVAAGDSGSFDTTSECAAFGTPSPTNPICNAPYSVDHPASDPLVTAAGGTTLPFSYKLTDGIRLSVPDEQAWSWSYIAAEAEAQGHGADITVPDVFSVGGGGGVSSYWLLPYYQFFTRGTTLTKPGQVFIADFGSGPALQNRLLPYFPGRNMPDVSTNADPQSGYQFIEEKQLSTFNGGTSFVAPQLNGVTALFVEGLGHRVGQLNPTLYGFGDTSSTDITKGNNWGYVSTKGYDNAAGTGTLDAEKLFKALKAK